ncbi:MAG: MBL fold metallo-hydrolase [Chloroflexi bacterium]|nr:MBL fold metallo-hydrolase [Chloroflexota bacterium]
MRMKDLEIYLLNDGAVKVDGGSTFGNVPREAWETMVKPDRRHRVRWGINALLIKTRDLNILVDDGAGAKLDEEERENKGLNCNRLKKELRELDLSPRDINYVVLTHLHFLHAGGSTRRTRNGDVVAAFPQARYLVQRTAWEDALAPNELGKRSFNSEDFLPLEKSGHLELIDGDYEIQPGVNIKVTDGHCRGHQVVVAEQLGNRFIYLGDLVPTAYHLGLPTISSQDQFPEDTLEQKRKFLNNAERDGSLLLFSHGTDTRGGYLERRSGKLALTPVAV